MLRELLFLNNCIFSYCVSMDVRQELYISTIYHLLYLYIKEADYLNLRDMVRYLSVSSHQEIGTLSRLNRCCKTIWIHVFMPHQILNIAEEMETHHAKQCFSSLLFSYVCEAV